MSLTEALYATKLYSVLLGLDHCSFTAVVAKTLRKSRDLQEWAWRSTVGTRLPASKRGRRRSSSCS